MFVVTELAVSGMWDGVSALFVVSVKEPNKTTINNTMK